MDDDAPDRDALAADRTMLASERTLAAWWRTALAALAASIGLARFVGDAHGTRLVQAAATLPVLLALLVLFMAARRYSTTARRVESQCVDRVPRIELWLGTILLGLLALTAALVVWGVL